MAVIRGRLAAALLAACLAGAACAPRGDSGGAGAPAHTNGSTGEAMSDAAFEKIALDTFDPSPGSPKVEDDFTGIRIAMPARVSVDRLERLPLCGVWVFSGVTMRKFPNIEDSLAFLARNVVTHETAIGNFRMHEDPATPAELKAGAEPAPPRSGDEPELLGPESVTARGYFNFNLGRPWKVPERAGRWQVTLILQDVRSNTVEFEVVK